MARPEHSKRHANIGFVNVDNLVVILLLGISTAIAGNIAQRYELPWYGVVLLIAAIAGGIVASVTGIGLLCVRVSESIEQRQRKRRRGFASHELLYEILIFGGTIAVLLPIAQALAERNELSSWWIPVIFVGLMASLIGIFYVFGKVSRLVQRSRKARRRHP